MIPFYIDYNMLPWYERPQFPTSLQKFLLRFKPVHTITEGSVTVYYKKLGNTRYVTEIVTKFL
jgi:hypothetical protein